MQVISDGVGSVAGVTGLEAWRATFRPDLLTIERIVELRERGAGVVTRTSWIVTKEGSKAGDATMGIPAMAVLLWGRSMLTRILPAATPLRDHGVAGLQS